MEHPGRLFVWATLIPLASFVVLLIVGGLRNLARTYRTTGLGGAIYGALGGDQPQKIGAYIATGAIGLAFFFSLWGFLVFLGGQSSTHQHSDESHHLWAETWNWMQLSVREDFKDQNSPPRLATALQLGYRIDSLSAVMFVMVTFIATLIHIFSLAYMSDELSPVVEDHQVHTDHGHLHRKGRYGRFFLFLSLFCFSMLNLVLADNLFQVFLSWELVGICSYLLIGFYFERQSASNAANKAFITNRIGDAGFIVGVMILWTYVGTLNFEEMFARIRCPERDSHKNVLADHQLQVVRANLIGKVLNSDESKLQVRPDGDYALIFAGHLHGEDLKKGVVEAVNHPSEDQMSYIPYWLLVTAGLGVFLGCVGKSAQFPLHVWLPDAMEGPTPVSALIHAATMVAAGVYLVGRCFPLFVPESRLVIAYTGGITLFVAATIALVMTDIKKVLAYSTVSQLGYMMLALGVGGWVAGLFHLVTHAFFKALLFLGSGSVIYGCHHEQDMRRMGGLYPKMRITALTMLMGVLAIAGIPLFSGWYSKDAILASALGFAKMHPQHYLLFLLPLITAGITAFYMFRMWFMTFTGEPRDHHVYEHAHESPSRMTVPLIFLAVCSVCVAWGWPVWDPERSALEHQLEHSEPPSLAMDMWQERQVAVEVHSFAGNLALGLVITAIIFASLVYYRRRLDAAEAQAQFPQLFAFLANKWYFDELYSALLVRPSLAVAGWCRGFDLKVLDGIIDSLGRVTIRLSDWDGLFDARVVDGAVNLTARVIYSTGTWLRHVQTGYIRSYVLFLVVAAVGLVVLLSYYLSMATAG